MPSSVSPLNLALRLLRTERDQLNSPRTDSKAPDVRDSAVRAKINGNAGATAMQGLPAKLRTASAQAGGKLSRSKTLRLFVEASLLDELGAELQLDPAFNDLVERTCRAIERNPACQSILDDALASLQALS